MYAREKRPVDMATYVAFKGDFVSYFAYGNSVVFEYESGAHYTQLQIEL